MLTGGDMLSRAAARRGAINLNNCGVILLSHRHWADAIDTFKDAMQLMKSAANEQGGTVSEQELQLALQRACQRTAHVFPITDPTQEANQGPLLKVISSQCNPATVCAFLNINDCPQDIKFLVTIDPIDFEGWESDVSDLEAACILYNFGIAHSLSSFSIGCGYERIQLQENAYRILQLTHALAFKLFRKAVHKSHLSNPIMLINMLLTLKLMHHSSTLSHTRSVTAGTREQYCGSLQELVFLIHAHQKLMPVVDHKFAPAA